MTIGKRLILAALGPALVALIVSLTLFFSYGTMETARNNGDLVRQVRSGITELNQLAFSYIQYHEERPKQQFLTAHASLTNLITAIQLRNPEQRQILERIRLNNELSEDLFLRLVAYYERSSPATGSQTSGGMEDLLVGQLLAKSYEADVDSSLLRSLVDDDLWGVQQTAIIIILLATILPTVALTIALVRMRSGITRSLAVLLKGTEAVGTGSLDYRINMASRDELGDLARSFDGMVGNLQAVTVSRDDLQREVTERKKAEEEVKRLNADLERRAVELEASNKELEAFSYSVSHDLRAPLRHVDGFSQAILEDYADKLDAQGKEYLQQVRASSQLMARLIDDLLNLSRITRSEMVLEKVNLSELAQESVDELRRNQPERKVEFAITSGLEARGDKRLMKIVFQNLLANAFKFTSKTADARIEFGASDVNGIKAYYVRDNGVGFDAAYIDKLFKPFQRLHRAEDFAGTGIGLALVYRIITRLGGKVWAEGQLSKGATFYFTLLQD